jgi:hypothetical protein
MYQAWYLAGDGSVPRSGSDPDGMSAAGYGRAHAGTVPGSTPNASMSSV